MTQDQLIFLLFKIVLVADLVSVFIFIVIYSVLAPWWKDVIGRTIAIKDILLGAALVPSVLSLFFHLSQLSSRLMGWIDVATFAGIALVMLWRCVVWVRIHRDGKQLGWENFSREELWFVWRRLSRLLSLSFFLRGPFSMVSGTIVCSWCWGFCCGVFPARGIALPGELPVL